MSSDEAIDVRALKSAAEERKAAFSELFRLLSITPRPKWATPALIGLGLLSSIAETAGIYLIILFLHAAMGQLDNVAGMFGPLSEAILSMAGEQGTTLTFAVIIFLVIVARAWVAFGYDMLGEKISQEISEAARNNLHRQYLRVSYEFLAARDEAKLLETLNSDSWLIAGAYTAYTKVIIGVCSIVVFGIVLWLLNWEIAIVAAIGASLIALLLRWLSRPTQSLGGEANELHSSLGEQMLMTVQGMRTIRAFAQESVHQKRFELYSGQVRKISERIHRTTALLEPVTDIGYLGILCAILALASFGQNIVGTIILAVAILYRMQPYVSMVANNMLYVVQVQSQLRSVREMLQTDDKEYPPEGDVPLTKLASKIEFKDVVFKYKSAPVQTLNGVSFTIPVGKTTALIGSSGAGKSTVVNLLLRLYEPSGGEILIDGTPLPEFRREDWLRQLAVAGQDVNLIEGNVIDNIRLADSEATDRQVRDVCRAAGVSEFVAELPFRYRTWIGQQGTRFSGGQRQRMGLARALLRNPNLLILDEAMSALDRIREEQIRQAIRKRYSKRTVLLITHRLDTVLDADHIICLANGRVVAEGAPATLLAAKNSVLREWLEGEVVHDDAEDEDGPSGKDAPAAGATPEL